MPAGPSVRPGVERADRPVNAWSGRRFAGDEKFAEQRIAARTAEGPPRGRPLRSCCCRPGPGPTYMGRRPGPSGRPPPPPSGGRKTRAPRTRPPARASSAGQAPSVVAFAAFSPKRRHTSFASSLCSTSSASVHRDGRTPEEKLRHTRPPVPITKNPGRSQVPGQEPGKPPTWSRRRLFGPRRTDG